MSDRSGRASECIRAKHWNEERDPNEACPKAKKLKKPKAELGACPN
jgi:hypothetical protein